VADLLVDTDVFIDHLRGAVALVPGRHRIHYSVITRTELFAGNTATDLSSQLLAPFRELGVDRAIVHSPQRGRTVEVDILKRRSIRYGDPTE
jgi:predicted nucleic acid-binding protein